MPGSLDPPGAASAALHAFWQPFEQYGWTVLLTLITLFLAWRYGFQAWQQRRRTADPVHAEDVLERARAARLAQQAAWTAVAPTAHRLTEERRQRIHSAAPPPAGTSTSTASAASASEERLSYDEVFGCELDEEFYKKRKEKKYRQGSLYSTSHDDDSTPSRPTSSSSSSSSGFKPYQKPTPSGGGRRFGGGPPKGGG